MKIFMFQLLESSEQLRTLITASRTTTQVSIPIIHYSFKYFQIFCVSSFWYGKEFQIFNP